MLIIFFWDQSAQRGQCILISVVLTPSPPSHLGSLWLLPVISLLLTNTVPPVRASRCIWLERFRGTQKEDECGPLKYPVLYEGAGLGRRNFKAPKSPTRICGIICCSISDTRSRCTASLLAQTANSWPVAASTRKIDIHIILCYWCLFEHFIKLLSVLQFLS